jgi:hypothetical protein
LGRKLVRSVLIIVVAEGLDAFPRVLEINKLVFIEALVAQLAIEAFDEAVLRRFPRRDEAMRDVMVVRPAFERQASKPRPLSVSKLAGWPRTVVTKSRTRATRGPDNDPSISIHKHSRM